jgi:general secretion pathway protein A
VITGEVGVGKTTILRSYLERVTKEKTKVIYIFNANVSFQNLVRTIYKELGLLPKTEDVVEMLNGLYQILMEEYKQGNTVLLIIDEAQNMPVRTLENLRMLSNLETSKDKLLQIVLVGQCEFENTINRYNLRQLKQRIAIRSTIVPFTKDESVAYIKHRLGKAASNGSPVFTGGALKRIVKESKGIPRNLNILCDNVLITGFGYKIKPVNTKIVKEVIADFNGKEKPPLWKWVIPPTALLLFIVGLFLIYPYKGLILSGVENFISPNKTLSIPKVEDRDLSETAIQNPIKEETKPSVDKPEIPQTEQTPLIEEKMNSPEEKKNPEQSVASSSTFRTVKRGDNLFRMTEKVYGHVNDKLVAMVKQNNPRIKDVDHILVGEEIIFPELTGKE